MFDEKAYRKLYRANNKDALNAWARADYAKNIEKQRARHRKYRKEHPEKFAEWRKKNYSKVRAYQREWGRRHIKTPRGHYLQSVSTAKYKRLDWNISLSDYSELMAKRCFYCDGALPLIGIGLDRIDNAKGYLIGNIVPCCTVCNRIRGDNLTSDEMKFVIKSLKEFRLKKILEGVI